MFVPTFFQKHISGIHAHIQHQGLRLRNFIFILKLYFFLHDFLKAYQQWLNDLGRPLKTLMILSSFVLPSRSYP